MTEDDQNFHDVSESAEKQASKLGDLLAEQLESRRGFLGKTAAVGLASATLAGGASAQHGGGNSNGNGGSKSNDDSNPPEGEVTLKYLRFALTLEHLEATFYREGLERFSDSELRNADILCRSNEALNEGVPARIREISEHEQDHVAALSAVVKALGGDPSQRFEFAFPYDDASGFLRIAQLLETTGVSAYDGALAFIGNNLPAFGANLLQTAGATIATVEARHTAFLNTALETVESPFPTSFDEPQTMDSILAKASPFIQGFKDDRQRFLVQVENVSTKDTYSVGDSTMAVPLSPGAYGVHDGPNPVYTPGENADNGLERIAEDGFPIFAAQTLAGEEGVIESGTFSAFSSFPPAITPTETSSFFITGASGDKLSFATMFVPSNDLFIGPNDSGISLFENGEPISGEVTDQLTLYDAGTEVDQEGVGSFAKPNQALLATDVGQAEDAPIRPAREANQFEYPDLSEVLKVTVTPV